METMLIELDEPSSASAFQEIEGIQVGGMLERHGLDGMSAISVLVTFATAAVPALTKILLELIRQRRVTSIQVRGLKVTNLTEEKALEILREFSKPKGKVAKE